MTPHEADELPDWRHDAACRDLDPELFFPDDMACPTPRQAERAKQVCDSRPTGSPCLDFALRHGLDYGVWGEASPGRDAASCGRRTAA
jgi:WhiB family transcriptional regulator, redox-sensing transcriptional regulator